MIEILKFDRQKHAFSMHYLFLESLPELFKQLDSMGLAPLQRTDIVIWNSLFEPAIDNGFFLVLKDGENLLGYEIVVTSPYDSRTVIASFTFIKPAERGKGYSHLLRNKMFDLVTSRGIKRIFFTILNSNQESIGNLESMKKKFKIQEVSKTYCAEL